MDLQAFLTLYNKDTHKRDLIQKKFVTLFLINFDACENVLMKKILFTILLTSCFNPNVEGVVWTCKNDNIGQCPVGKKCVLGKCVSENTTSDLATVDDMSMEIVDLKSDMYTIPPDMANNTGCSNVIGINVAKFGSSKKVYACPGKFFPADVSKICKSAYKICDNTAPIPGDTIDFAACNSLSGYFLTSIKTQIDGAMKTAYCGYGNMGGYPILGFGGCGTSNRKATLVVNC